MKKLLISLLCVSTVFCAEPQFDIVDYNPSHKDAVVEIVFENPETLGGMTSAVVKPYWDFYIEWHKNKIEESLVDPLVIKKVIVDDSGKVVAFIFFLKKEREV